VELGLGTSRYSVAIRSADCAVEAEIQLSTFNTNAVLGVQGEELYGILVNYFCDRLKRYTVIQPMNHPRDASDSRGLIPTFHCFARDEGFWLNRCREVTRTK
jgi:hypothetical protein